MVYLSIYRWKNIDNFISMSNILFSLFISFVANCGSLFNIMLSDNLCYFYILSLNSLTNSCTVILSSVATKYVILDNLLHTTNIAFFSATNGSFIIKLTIRYIYSFSSTSLNLDLSASTSVWFFILWQILHLSTYFLIFLVTNFVVFYLLLCSVTSILCCSQIISILNSSFFSIYIFSSFNTKSPSICYSSPCNTLTPTIFISSTTLATSSSLLLAIFIFFQYFYFQFFYYYFS